MVLLFVLSFDRYFGFAMEFLSRRRGGFALKFVKDGCAKKKKNRPVCDDIWNCVGKGPGQKWGGKGESNYKSEKSQEWIFCHITDKIDPAP